MSHIDTVYKKLCNNILEEGYIYKDVTRDNIKMLQIPSYTLDIDISKGFPIITTKRISWKTVLHELIWMLSGSTNIDYLKENNVKIWDKDAYNFSGSSFVGRIYGAQWRNWIGIANNNVEHIDQINNLVKNIKKNPHSRRHLVTAWNPVDLQHSALPPCHWSFEFIPNFGINCNNKGFTIKWHQRSCDVFLGIPFDIVLYSLLGYLIEYHTGLKFERLIGDLSNVHFYEPHIKLIKMQLDRKPFPDKPYMVINNFNSFSNKDILDSIDYRNIDIKNYKFHPAIKAEMYAKVSDL